MATERRKRRRLQSPLVRGSYEELLRFLRYYRHFGTPTIIGGWAVYFYNPYYGSVDIDVVGPSFRGSFYDVIETYERSHGYTIAPNDPFGIEVVASKPIYNKSKRKIGDMEIDACSYEQSSASIFHEDEKKASAVFFVRAGRIPKASRDKQRLHLLRTKQSASDLVQGESKERQILRYQDERRNHESFAARVAER
ncbi:MAG: hypothetical protein ACYCPW_10715 [Nitrososphaerales archaeon]